MAIEWLTPDWLFLALLVPLVWVWPRRRPRSALAALRALVLILLVLAAAQPVRPAADGQPWHVLVLDQSASLAPEAIAGPQSAARSFFARLPKDDHRVLVTFGGTEAGGEALQVPEVERHLHVASLPAGRDTSPLAVALAAAARTIPTGARGSLTLCTDGLATRRSWGPTLQALSVRGLPVHVLPLSESLPAAAIVGVRGPDFLRVGATARLTVRIRAPAGAQGVVRLSGPEGTLAESPPLSWASADPEAPVVEVPLSFEAAAAGFLPVTVSLLPGPGSAPATDAGTWTTTLAVQDPLQVLYLGARIAGGAAALGALLGPGFDIRDVPKEQREEAGLLTTADLVVLDDCPASDLPATFQAELAEAVQSGQTGLFVSGGRASFGAGGYQDSPLAALLPVRFVQRQEKRDPSTTLAIVIDTSGSMGGNRVQLAKEVARLAIRRLLPHDKVGIVEFYGAKRWAAPIQPASNAIEIQRALNRLNAGGGTVIMPAMEEAFYGLQNVRTRYKHVLVLTDGGVEQGAFEPLVRRMAAKGITVSTVLIGPDAHSEFLVSIANWGKGRFYSVPNRFNLPEVLLKQPSSAHLPAWRPGKFPVETSGGAGWWGGVQSEDIPALAGYVEAERRPGAEVLLRVQGSTHPLLSTWRFGAGRTTAFLSEPVGPASEGWAAWPGYGESLARILARTAADTRAPFAFVLTRRDGRVRLTARRLQPGRALPRAQSIGGTPAFTLREGAPGLYEAEGAAPEQDLLVRAGVGGRLDTRLVSPVSDDVVPERQVDPSGRLDLDALATATGGTRLSLADLPGFQPPLGGGGGPVGLQRLWPGLLLAALLLYLLEIFLRRLPARSSGESGEEVA